MQNLVERLIPLLIERAPILLWKCYYYDLTGISLAADAGPFTVGLSYSPNRRRWLFWESRAKIQITITDRRNTVHCSDAPDYYETIDRVCISDDWACWGRLLELATSVAAKCIREEKHREADAEEAKYQEVADAIEAAHA